MARISNIGHRKFILLVSALLLITSVIACSVGSVKIPFSDVIHILLSRIPVLEDYSKDVSGTYEIIVILIRIPRILLGILAGFGLAVAGTSMQGVFKNPMASPFILGASAGASLGAALGIYFGVGIFALPFFAFAFAMGAAMLVFLIGRAGGRTEITTLLLAGLAINFLMGALYGAVWYLSPTWKRIGITRWIWGSLNGTIWDEIYIVLPIVIFASAALYAYSRDLNVIQLGEESAIHLGIEVESVKLIQLGLASFLTAAVISFTGVIGFVGLIIPHAARLIVGPDHKKLFPASALLGGLFLLVCDTISRLSGVLPRGEMPVGIITGLIGVPFFLYLLVKKRGDTGW
ncbi:MAG: iron chelate uptake ABC transporter family permease subunit [Thermoplasmata archaeon]